MTGHLIHIGFPKTGSNFLRRWFSIHPQLGYVEGGIAGFRTIHDVPRQAAAPRPGLAYRVSSSESLVTPHSSVGEQTVDHERMVAADIEAAQAEACGMLASLFPNAHILLVTRGFRAMILSAYSQMARTGYDGGFEAWCERLHDEASWSEFLWNYDQVVRLYSEAFPGRLLVMPYELLRDDAGAFVRTLEGWLELDHCPPTHHRDNPALSPQALYWYPRLTARVRRLPIGKRLRGKLLRLYLPLVRTDRLRLPIRLLGTIRPFGRVTPDLVTDELVKRFGRRAESLRGNPLYAPYADDYLI